jgi:predicted cupin superfamily sugar epimerase
MVEWFFCHARSLLAGIVWRKLKAFRVSRKILMDANCRDSRYWVEKLRLEPHPEGGYYRQTYRADLTVPREALPPDFAGSRSAATAIYFLLTGKNFSAFHRLRSDELWHFYAGQSLFVHVIAGNGTYSPIALGSNAEAGEVFQAVVKAGAWFASEVRDPNAWALVGCTVAPGFDFADFQLGRRDNLLKQFPQYKELIERLTRE